MFTATSHESALPALAGCCQQVNQKLRNWIFVYTALASAASATKDELLAVCVVIWRSHHHVCLIQLQLTVRWRPSWLLKNKHKRAECVLVAEDTGTDNRIKLWLRSIKTTNFSVLCQQSQRVSTKLLHMDHWVTRYLWLESHTESTAQNHGCTYGNKYD